MVNNWKLSWNRLSPALKHKTKHSDKLSKKEESLSKIKHKNVKPTINETQT